MSNLRRDPNLIAQLIRTAAWQLETYPDRAEFIAMQLQNVANDIARRDMDWEP